MAVPSKVFIKKPIQVSHGLEVEFEYDTMKVFIKKPMQVFPY